MLLLQVISLAGWVNIMYYIQDAHSFWDWIYFVALIIVSATVSELLQLEKIALDKNDVECNSVPLTMMPVDTSISYNIIFYQRSLVTMSI